MPDFAHEVGTPLPHDTMNANVSVALLAATVLSPLAVAQHAPYDVVRLGPAPGSTSSGTTGASVNDHGVVVGNVLTPETSPQYRAWRWDAASGYTVLPHVNQPGFHWGTFAVDVDNEGTITGDGGFDTGIAWRLLGGQFAFFTPLPGQPLLRVGEANESGQIVAVADDFSFSTPASTLLAELGAPNVVLFGSDYGGMPSVNELGQISGTQGLSAFRWTPGVGTVPLPKLPNKQLAGASDINDFGHVVGNNRSETGNFMVPFLYTDEGGTVKIGDFVSSGSAVSINNRGEVVGSYKASIPHPWVWNERDGVAQLGTLIDPAEQLNLLDVVKINEAGVILAQASDQVTGYMYPVLLVPTDGRGWSAPRNGAGDNPFALLGLSAPSLGATFELRMDDGALPGAEFAVLGAFLSPASGLALPFGELLVDPSTAPLFTSLVPFTAGVAVHALGLPADPALQDARFTLQGLLLHADGTAISTNAVDVELGT